MKFDLPRRHHYLPQFLLKGFASRITDKDFYAWMFRCNLPGPIETNLKNLAQQRDFHGHPKDSPLELMMSEYEDRFAPVVQQLRSWQIPEESLPTIREFVVHLMIRTKNVRAGFIDTTQELLDQIGESIPSSDGKKWKNRIRKGVRKQMRNPKVRDRLRHLSKEKRRSLTQDLENEILKTDFRPAFSNFFDSFRQMVDLEGAAHSAHIKTLTRAVAPQQRMDSISHLQWQLLTAAPHSFILGDVGVIGRCEGDVEYRNLINSPTRVEMVVTPVSHSVCLIGSSGTTKLPEVHEINESAAQLSREFFVASQSTEREKTYKMHLAKRAALISDEELCGIVNEIL